MSEVLERLKKQAEGYGGLKTSKERALLLRLLTEGLEKAVLFKGPGARSKDGRINKWLKENCPGYEGNFVRYQRLLSAGEASTPLWEAIDNGTFSIGVACHILWDAKDEQDRRHLEGEESVALSVLVRQQVELEKTGKRKPRYERSHSKKKKEPKDPSEPKAEVSQIGKTKSFYKSVRTLVDAQIEPYLQAHIGDVRAKQVGDKLIADLYAALTSFTGGISRLRDEQQGASIALKVGEVRKACLILNIDPPRGNKPVDIKAAHRRMKLLAREYHPDMRGGDESMRGKLEAVLAAYDKCEVWNQTVGAVNQRNGG